MHHLTTLHTGGEQAYLEMQYPKPKSLIAFIFCWSLIFLIRAGGEAVDCLVFAQYARVLLHWRGWFVYSLITGMLILIFWGAFVQGASGTIAVLVPLVGLSERLSAGSHALWMCLLVVTLFFRRRRIEETMN